MGICILHKRKIMNKIVTTLVLLFTTNATVYGADLRFIEAAKENNAESVHLMLNERVNVNEQQADGATALHWAIHWDNLNLVEKLIQAHANVNIADENGATPIWVAASNGNADIVNILLEAGANPNAQLSTGETPLMTAAEIGSLDVVKTLLMAKADANARETQGGQTGLMWAVAEGHTDIARALIEDGANIHDRSKGGFTALHFASQNNTLESAQILMSMDADVNETSLDNSSPLLLAAAGGHDAVTQFLLELGADPSARDFKGYTALHYAAMRRQMLGSVRGLLAKGADPNAQISKVGADHELHPVPDLPFLKSPTRIVPAGTKGGTIPAGATPMYLAAQSRNPAAMRLLAENGADIELGSNESVYFLGGSGRRVNYIAGTTPLMAAAGMDRVITNWVEYPEVLEMQALEAVKVAIELGADVNATNEYGLTALHGASFINADPIIEFLVNNGADIDAKDRFGQTALSITNHVVVVGLGDYFDVRPRRSSPSTTAVLMKLGATPLELSGVVAR
jgi:ankyrin repeat protein